jgi:hypothetical protein
MKIQQQSVQCPQCESTETLIKATVSVGRWERHFCECPACELSFIGSWYGSDEIPSAVLNPLQHRPMLLAPAV